MATSLIVPRRGIAPARGGGGGGGGILVVGRGVAVGAGVGAGVTGRRAPRPRLAMV